MLPPWDSFSFAPFFIAKSNDLCLMCPQSIAFLHVIKASCFMSYMSKAKSVELSFCMIPITTDVTQMKFNWQLKINQLEMMSLLHFKPFLLPAIAWWKYQSYTMQ